MEDYEQTYVDFWQELVEKDGVMDPDKVKRELYDYRITMQEVAKAYDHLTFGRISKPNTRAEVVIDEAEAAFRRWNEEGET